MTLYELNKSAYASLPDITDEQKEIAEHIIERFIAESNEDYFMLLNNELHYYTIFHWVVIDSLSYHIKSIERTNDETAIEVWLTTQDNECHMFLLFGYTNGVIEL